MSSTKVIVSAIYYFILLVSLAAAAVLGASAAEAGAAGRGRGGILHIPSAAELARARCPSRCGHVDILYPFGIGPGCFRQGFDLICDKNTTPPRLFLGNSTIQVNTMYPGVRIIEASAVHFNVTMISGMDTYNMSWEAPVEGVTATRYVNYLHVVGCGVGVYWFGHDTNDPMGSCMSICLDDKKAMKKVNDAAWHYFDRDLGMGCCAIRLQEDVRAFGFMVGRLNGGVWALSGDVLSNVKVFLSSDYKFATSDIYSSRRQAETAPPDRTPLPVFHLPPTPTRRSLGASFPSTAAASTSTTSDMAAFTKLEDSPMFRKQVNSLEQLTDELKQRCSNLHKGCKRFMGSLDEGYAGDLLFADALEAFGAGRDDPVSVAIGGPVMSKFTTAFRELGTYKELLRSQVEHMLSERLTQFINEDLHDAKDCRQRLDKATVGYDQAREKFVSVRKGTRAEVVTGLEEDLHNGKSAFERSRFNLVHALANIEAKKKYEFLESISAVMDAHLRYFKQGFELLSQMEPFIHQVLTYAQQSKEMAMNEQDKLAKRIQEFRTQEEIANLRMASNVNTSTSGDGIHVVGLQSYKKIEALMQSTANGQVQIIKQGYLFKRSENLRGEWKRRYFVLDSHGTLYYYGNKQGVASQQTTEGTGVFSRFKFLNQKASSQGDDPLSCRTINLRTSTIKMDAEENDLRFCFRVISPMKAYTLQAETEADQKDWIEKITGVIASLLNSPLPPQLPYGNLAAESHSSASSADLASLEESKSSEAQNDALNHLRTIPGNDCCAECRAPDPDWASLNLGILICIQCSGAHRNLGVHISKVRSLRLDVKVWEPVIIDLFRALGNDYNNSIWEALLPKEDQGMDESNSAILFMEKPKPTDAFSIKERFIQSKYVDKLLIAKDANEITIGILEAIRTNDVRAVYRILVLADASPNMTYDDLNNDVNHVLPVTDKRLFDPASCERIEDSGKPEGCLQGCSLLHIACQCDHPLVVELLLLFGADINKQDFHGRTPLHHCVQKSNDALTKHLLKRGARTTIKDGGGLTALERRMELGAITDEELFILFVR
ncbi:hypothetical protein ACQ4PT_063147 [Festuca glaucescens]